jgi:hypothetical protein
MKQTEAVLLANEYREKLMDRTLSADSAWKIQDVIFCGDRDVNRVYEKMWQDNIGNVQALAHFPSAGDKYEVYVIAHQWPWGSGDLVSQRLASYLKENTFK